MNVRARREVAVGIATLVLGWTLGVNRLNYITEHKPLPIVVVQNDVTLQNMPGVIVPVKPQPVEKKEPHVIISRSVPLEVRELVGTFSLSFYTPSTEECDSDPWTTAWGTRTKPGVTVAIDRRYWKLGTKFYVEGFGYVIGEDTGSKIKGRYSMDVCIASKETALKYGVLHRKVWVIK